MRLLNSFGEARYHLRENLVENRFSVFLAGLFGRNFTKLFVKNEEEGYSRTKDDVKIKMTRSVHFTDIILRKPLEGYKKEIQLKEINTIIDAGAFPGEFAIYAAKKEDIDVIALEPDPKNAEELRENIQLNDVENNVTVVEKGLWKKKDEKGFERDKELGMSSKINDNGSMTIDLDTLDNIVSENDEPDLVKMDIEGAEVEALEGAERVLSDIRPKFSIATYHRRENSQKTFHHVEKIFENHNYNTKTSYKRHLTTYAKPD